VQPIRKFDNGQVTYVFSDEEIRSELEDYHIRKVQLEACVDQRVEADLKDRVSDLVRVAKNGCDNVLMNAEISDHEVKGTFGKGSDTSGPDAISAKLIDGADRVLMHQSLKLIWNKAWIEGNFPSEWKREDRILIAKVGKDDYNDCHSYRTVSVRFEHITSQRLIGVLKECHFDCDQFAYLKNRSATQAVLVVTENIKKALIEGHMAAAVFFDFTDAFGSVNRNRLLLKLANDFGISGRLLRHLESFLNDRFARIKYDDSIGDWIQSFFGTSAFTSLGPLLFIVQVHDVPKCIKPKFADDLVAVSVGSDIQIKSNQMMFISDNSVHIN